jgi:hypothetical protein
MANKFDTLGFSDREAAAIEVAARELDANEYDVAVIAYNAHALRSIDSVTVSSVSGAYRSVHANYAGA